MSHQAISPLLATTASTMPLRNPLRTPALTIIAALGLLAGAAALILVVQAAALPVAQTEMLNDSSAIWLALAIAAGAMLCYLAGRHRHAMRRIQGGCDSLEFTGFSPESRLFDKRDKLLAALTGDVATLFENRLQVRHVMTDKLTMVGPDMPVRDIEGLFEDIAIRHVPVCDEEGGLIGVISDRDLSTRRGRRASDTMSTDVQTVSPSTHISAAAGMMTGGARSCLPVVENGKLQGLVTTTDLVVALQCALQVLWQQVRAGVTADLPKESAKSQEPR